MQVHTIFDVLAWLAAAAVARWIALSGLLDGYGLRRSLRDDPAYFICLATGALVGAYLFGSFNLGLAHIWTFGHSIAGAIAGGIVAVELYKLWRGIRGSTGQAFVAPLALGIAVGRLGCFFSGLPDYTYGTPTALPWAVDFGDGIRRHPVQLYESAAMFAFLAVYVAALHSRYFFLPRAQCGGGGPRSGGGGDYTRDVCNIGGDAPSVSHGLPSVRSTSPILLRKTVEENVWADYFLRNSFYLFVGWYALQRFAWEFLKPYPTLIGPFNLFHLICIVLLGYSVVMLRGNHELRTAG